jgi:hypothetical protein
MKMRFILTLLVFAALLDARAAQAACTSPSGSEGDIIYNNDYHVVQFCDNTSWKKVGGGTVDSRIGTLTNGKWCTTNGTAVNCTSDAPAVGKPIIIDSSGRTPSGAPSAAISTQTFDSSCTFSKPDSGTYALLECWGGGGGGRNSSYRVGGGGGGGGEYSSVVVDLSSMSASTTITIGAGGAGGANSTVGSDGGDSTIGSLLTAQGGKGGGTYVGLTGGGAGGLGGGVTGGVGGNGVYFNVTADQYQKARVGNQGAVCGGGGGGGGANNATNYTTGALGGSGGPSVDGLSGCGGGAGGKGADGITSANGSAGSVPGGGGGGGAGSTAAFLPGYAGASGRCKISVY